MNNPNDPHFDQYAHDYHDLHKSSISVSGEEPEYFAAYKVSYMAERLGSEIAHEPLSLMDFGCGIGNSLPHLRHYFPNAKLHGVDVSGESIEMARSKNPDVQFDLVADGKLMLPDRSIDVAMAACVYHHISPADRLMWTSEIHRVLKPGGQLFIFEHNPLNPLTQKVVRDCPFDDNAILLGRQESLKLLANSGFDQQHVSYIVFFPKFLSLLRPLERLLGWLPLGAQYVARGRA